MPPSPWIRWRTTPLVLDIGIEDQVTHALLGVRVGNRTQLREAAPLTVDGVLASRERDVPPGGAASFPNGEGQVPMNAGVATIRNRTRAILAPGA